MTAQIKKPGALVVEDEPLILMLAMDIIDDLGFRAIPAPNAEEAMSLLESRDDIRFLFTDVNMPGAMDGVALANAVKGRWPPVKILVTSGRPISADLLPAGSAFLQKPYDLPIIRETLHDMFA